MKVEKCKGFKDTSPADMESFRRLEAVFHDTCSKWGYQEIRTPTLEYLYLFTSVGTLTPGMLRRVYSFLDWDGWSGERVVLKPDGTIPAARFYVENMKKGLARLFYITNVFIFEETGKKPREKWQCGAELIGENSAAADVELIALTMDVLKRLGIEDIRIKISHAGLIRALLQKLELEQQEKDRIFDRVLEGDIEALTGLQADKPELVEALSLLLKLKGKSSGFLKNIKAVSSKKLPEFTASLDNFIGVVEQLEKLGCEYRIDLASGKGFEYYTGIIFHLYSGQEIIGGGGRYDDLIPQMGGKETPAAGFALYMDSLLKLVKTVDTAEKRVLISISPQAVKEGFDMAAALRQAGITAELALGDKKETDCGWLLEVKAGSPAFTLTDMKNNRKSGADSADGVLALLGCSNNAS